MSTHRHQFTPTQRLMLTLPELRSGRFDLFQAFRCGCGEERHCTSWSLGIGRHLTHDELQEIRRQEYAYGAGQAKPERRRLRRAPRKRQ